MGNEDHSGGSMGYIEEEVMGGGEEGKEKEETFESLSEELRELMEWEWKLPQLRKFGDFSFQLYWGDVNADLAKQDPWRLPRVPFILTKEASSNLRTDSGYWAEKENKLTAVRREGIGKEQKLTEAHDQGKCSSSGSPSYLGIKRTMEFRYRDGTKSPWLLHEYQLLDAHKNKPGLFHRGDLVTRKVFKNCSGGDEARQSSNKSKSVRLPQVVSERKRKLYQADPQSGQEPSGSGSGSGEHPHACAPQNGETEVCLSAPKHLHQDDTNDTIFFFVSEVLHIMEWKLFMQDLQEGGSSPRPAASRNKKSNVWQDFTKIYTKDPKVVHAVCHGCDRVFNAHPKIDGTSHLRRHRLACSSSSHSHPWSTEDQKILQDLRQAHDLYQQEKVEINANLAKLDPLDPQSTSGYVTSSLSRDTHQGCWKETKKRRTAICTDQLPVSPPRYGGMKTTLQSHDQDGNKMAYIMIEIQLVDDYNAPYLFLQGAVVFRKVFQNHKEMVSDSFSELDRCLNADDEEEEHYDGVHEDEVQAYTIGLQDCLVVGVDESRPEKRKRTSAPHGGSDVWLNFTRIYTSDPNKVYAVCHCCDICYNGHPKNGTSHLKRHNEKCSSKHQELPRHNDTGSANVTDPVWEAEIWPFIAQFLDNYEGTGEEIRTEAEVRNNEGDLGGWH